MIIKTDFCLKPFNTFGIEIMTQRCAQITSPNDMFVLFENNEFSKQPTLVIGEASNILFLDHFEGLVLMNLMRGKKIISETETEVILEVNAGEYWLSLVDFTVDKGWWGIENLSMIPGKVGAAPVQNIGAYGTELKDVFVSLEAFDMEKGEIVKFTNEDCQFEYRDSIFKNKFKDRFLILSVSLKLSKIPKPNLSYKALADTFKGIKTETISLSAIRDNVNQIRESKLPDPQKIKNAGSFFKNPVVDKETAIKLKSEFNEFPVYELSETKSKLAAAWLIDSCGWKGKRIGDAGVHDKQALVLVNLGNAKGTDILKLANDIEISVFEKFGIKLQKEVRIV